MLNKMTSKDIFNKVKSSLANIYSTSEASNIALLLLEHTFQLKKQDIILQQASVLYDYELVEDALARLQQHEPIQYILGEAHFFGLDFAVSPAVLIPRPETEELVRLIIDENENREDLKILDIGTGSGCIAISLAKMLKKPAIFAIDISQDALQIARKNAKTNHTKVHFHQSDILEVPHDGTVYDIIVSNPPYIALAEKAFMQANVLDFEPTQALFVPDDNSLLFYEKITLFAQNNLGEGGKLYFEINERFGNEVVDLLKTSAYFAEIQLVQDLQGKDRIVTATRQAK
ncbi:MAG: peptide chain release factor N(5)-glutamine methyltransferase [Cytophagales bacterium]|nr:MAG: peptide chain release factor N(5)-glutamine methyltransferase [Cytophagales bacterium]